MNVLEKAQKSLEYLKSSQSSNKKNELQSAAGTLGRCLGALGGRLNHAKHYANLLQSSVPVLLSLASNDSAEIRALGEEALDRAVVGGFAFSSYKINIILQNEIDHTKNARWIRAVLTRICLGDCWLRPGVGKIRSQAQTLIPKLSQILQQNTNLPVIVEALESNLPRILKALAEYSSDEELYDLAKALFQHVNSDQPPVRRGVAFSLAHLCLHRETLITQILSKTFENLWPIVEDNNTILGWFGVLKSLFQINDISTLAENDLFSTHAYLELYQLCINYLEIENNHNKQNAVMECLSVMISQAKGDFKRVLLDKQQKLVDLDCREKAKGHSRNISSVSNITSVLSNLSTSVLDDIVSHDQSELSFSGALYLGSLSQMQTPMTSVEDLTLQTPDSPQSDDEMNINSEVTCKSLSEKLEEIEVTSQEDDVVSEVQQVDGGLKVNIGLSSDVDIPLKYCARLLASKFLLTGNKSCQISDRTVRVSVKSSALTCLSEILQHYPQAMTMFLDKDAELKCQNISGSSDCTESRDNISDFILERNVCYQDSLSDSLALELLNKSVETQSYSKKISNETDMKSSKDVLSNILDSKEKLVISNQTDSSNQNTSFLSSNMTSNDANSTAYPLTSSGDIVSSSIDLDMKFDHFGESITNLENSEVVKEAEQKKVLKRIEPIDVVVKNDECEKGFEVFEFQHMSDVFVLLEAHTDPQIRGLVRVCIGNYLSSALDLSHGNYYRWRNYYTLTKDVNVNISTEKLINILLKGLSDEIHSCVNYTLSSLTKVFVALAHSAHTNLLIKILNSLVDVQTNPYWLCKVNLCKLYEKLPYQRLYILYPGTMNRCTTILNTLYSLLSDQDPNVRSVAANTITTLIPKIYPHRKLSQTACVTNSAAELSEMFKFDPKNSSLHLIREIYFYNDLPEQLKNGVAILNKDNLKITIADLFGRIMESSCKFYWQGLLEALHSITMTYKPWFHISVYENFPIMEYCLDSLDYCNSSVTSKTRLLDICTVLYPVEINKIINKSNKDIFERVTHSKSRWVHLDSEKCTNLAEKFLQITLKMLNVLVHLIEEVNPNVHLNKGGIALPGSPVRRKTQDSLQRKNNTNEVNDERNQRKKLLNANIKANLVGHFFNDPLYMKFYESLKAAYSNYKVKTDRKSSMFYDFLRSVLDALAIQLELSTEREFGFVTEELLYYLKSTMPFCGEKSIFCITQLLKCLFSTNMLSDYQDFMNIKDVDVEVEKNKCFYKDVLFINDLRNKTEINEKEFLITLENFHRNKINRKWGTNKKELERYIRLFELVVIQALKSYTMQNDVRLQCNVLCLLNQLLILRVNYCMLDSDQVFIQFLLKQLDYVEQHEIPDCCELVHNILLFLVQLSSSKHNSKQIIEIPKLMQLCDGLMASGSHSECVEALKPVVVRVFWMAAGSTTALGRTQQTEAQATKEVLFYMMQKTMHDPKVLDLVSCVLLLSQEHPESYYRWSELASDTLLNLLSQRSIDVESRRSVCSLEKVLDCIYSKVLLEQSRVEAILKILFKAPPDQATTPFKQKVNYLSIIMVLLRKLLTNIPENEILLSINYLKASFVSPQSLFFNVKNDIDPLNVQNINENCANLSPDVILVRFLFKTLTFAIIEIDNCNEFDSSDLIIDSDSNGLLYSVCINIVCSVKNMLHLTTGCLYPLTAKTAQNLLHNEQSGLNTGLYSPEENIPMEMLNLICLRSSHRMPLLTVHWSHLLIRLKFLEQKYWQTLLGYVRNLPLKSDNDDGMLHVNILQIGCFMSYCEYFVENGLSEAVHLTWLLVNRMHVLINFIDSPLVLSFVEKVQENASASGLLLQAVATRCQNSLKDEFALNTHKLLSKCHEKQSGALIFLCCRLVGKLEPAIAVKFVNLAVERCRFLIQLPVEDIMEQLTKEDVQVALELLQRSKVHIRYSALVSEINVLASSVFDLSPLDLDLNRAVNPQHVTTTNVDDTWLINQIKNRCCETTSNKVEKQIELATLISNLSKDGIETVLSCQEFDRNILNSCFKVSTDNYVKAFLNVKSVYETKHFESQRLREQREMSQLAEATVSNVDSNILNVANSLHVFKKTDSKESKSQFFIPMTDNVGEKFGKLEITETDHEFVPPVLPDLFASSLCCLEKNLSNLIRLFPKQNRPLSQSDNFDLNKEQTIDKYTRKCHEFFQEKEFLQNFCTIQNILTSYFSSLHRIYALLDDVDCELTDKVIDNILPTSISKQISIFTVISLQYLSFLIKNKKMVETPIHSDVSFRLSTLVQDKFIIDNIIGVTLNNCSKALSFKLIWLELNSEANLNRTQSAISCLYAVTKYFLQDTKPLKLKEYMKIQDGVPKSDVALTCNKLLTLIEFWETNYFNRDCKMEDLIMSDSYKVPIEKLLVCLARLDAITHVSLIPPIAWASIEANIKNDLNKIDLPLQALQDMDVLEPFLFRVNFIGWSSKKLFEEIWVGLLGALQGNGTHWAVRGITQLLVSTVPRVRRDTCSEPVLMHLPRKYDDVTNGMQIMRNLMVGTSTYGRIFDSVNLERIPIQTENMDGYHYAQFNTEYLKYASDIIDDASFRAKMCVKRAKRSTDVDVASCLQLLMDVATQMLHPKAQTGVAARCSLLTCIINISDLFTEIGQWCWLAQQLISLTGQEYKYLTQYSIASHNLLYGLSKCLSVLDGFDGLAELSTVHQKLLKSLSSSYAPLRQAALQGCLLELTGRAAHISSLNQNNPYKELVTKLREALDQYLCTSHRISLYEQTLYWTVLFTLVQLGYSELMHTAVNFLLKNHQHFCSDLVVKGITSTLRQQVLPKELKKNVIGKLLDNMKKYDERHAVQIFLVHLFTADNKLLSPRLSTDVSNMDPDVLMSSMERLTRLYKILKLATLGESKFVVAESLKYFLRETLPPAPILSRIVIEFIECCREAETCDVTILRDKDRHIEMSVLNAQIVYEVFQTALSQDQLPVVSGWIFEALSHLLQGKVTENLLPYILLCLLTSASPNTHVRCLAPLSFYTLRLGFESDHSEGIFKLFFKRKLKVSYSDRRLLCVVALRSGFSQNQLMKIQELCTENCCLDDLLKCLVV